MYSSTSLRHSVIIESRKTAIQKRRIALLTLVALCLLSIMVTVATHLPSLTYAASTTNLSIATGMQQAVADTKAKSTPGTATTKATTLNAIEQTHIAQQLVRLNQLDPAQYASTAEYNTWAYSACSAASMTEVINAFWGYQKYRITDILTQEETINGITTEAGLQGDAYIEKTMRRFGFTVEWGYKWSLQQIIDLGNAGQPVIVSFPPPWGHLLVVRGGDANNVFLADSSRHNLTVYPRAEFMKHWRGFVALAKFSPYSILGKETLTPTQLNTILAAYHSPLQRRGQDIYNTTKKYGIDDTLALGFYLHESTMGTQGEAATTHSWGNLRCVSDAACVNQQGTACQPQQSCYAAFPDGIAGLDRWCVLLLSSLYVGDGRVIVDDIIDRYAPSNDNNNVGGYIWNLKKSTDAWRSGRVTV